MTTQIKKRGRYIRFLWSHEAAAHRFLVRFANRLLALLPFALKYGVGSRQRRNRPPYALIRPGDLVVQVGAPWDTLRSGRSRAFYFGLFVGPSGRVIAVEPDAESVEALREAAISHGHGNVSVVPMAAWKERTQLRVYIDDAHPASNFTSGAKAYDEERMRSYRHVDLPADTLDAIVADAGVDAPVRLVSITTNGAEREILEGMRRLMQTGVQYIALADTGVVTEEEMAALGYSLVSFDDRGRTFVKSNGDRVER